MRQTVVRYPQCSVGGVGISEWVKVIFGYTCIREVCFQRGLLDWWLLLSVTFVSLASGGS